ncbi:hypothetical protein LCGC14_0399920 [marine sediment metagenome]|uniref:Uncharacterized protein n=1 Tax=marine sediment metagenome TaxID=412755 RepID=A0A0F9VJ38_9ZZZZ
MLDPHEQKDEVDKLLLRIRAARAVKSRRINKAAMELVDAACFSDTDTMVELARQIVEDAKERGAMTKWVKAIKAAHKQFREEYDTLMQLPEESVELVALEGEHT